MNFLLFTIYDAGFEHHNVLKNKGFVLHVAMQCKNRIGEMRDLHTNVTQIFAAVQQVQVGGSYHRIGGMRAGIGPYGNGAQVGRQRMLSEVAGSILQGRGKVCVSCHCRFAARRLGLPTQGSATFAPSKPLTLNKKSYLPIRAGALRLLIFIIDSATKGRLKHLSDRATKAEAGAIRRRFMSNPVALKQRQLATKKFGPKKTKLEIKSTEAVTFLEWNESKLKRRANWCGVADALTASGRLIGDPVLIITTPRTTIADDWKAIGADLRASFAAVKKG